MIHKGRERLQSYFGVIGPNQEAPQCQATLESQVDTLIILKLQLKDSMESSRVNSGL